MLHRTIAPGRTGYERYVVNFFETQPEGFIERVGHTAFDELLHCGCLKLPPDITRRVRHDLAAMDQALQSKGPYTNAAVHLLENSDLSLVAIAERCGFSNSNYFGDVFRRWKGIPPPGTARYTNRTSTPTLNRTRRQAFFTCRRSQNRN